MLQRARSIPHFRADRHVLALISSSFDAAFVPRAASLPPDRPLQNPTFPPVRHFYFRKLFSSESSFSSPPPPPLALFRGGCYDEKQQAPPLLPLCPGCGIHMQDSDPKLPGFFSAPSAKTPGYGARVDRRIITDEVSLPQSLKAGLLPVQKENEDEEGSTLVPEPDQKPIVCARCHSLRHYGQVKNAAAENLLPSFDFDRMVAPKIVSSGGARSVALMVVDASDFEGSFPRKVAKIVSDSIEENSASWKKGKPGNVPRVVLVVTKIDLLPSSLSPTGLEYWVRQRAREGGAVKLAAVHLVSAVKEWGVRNLVDHVRYLAGPRGSVWAVGAQNAGKSTLINAMGKCIDGKLSHLTEASVPGTTLGIVRVEGVLPDSAKLFDTPGILHPYQISTRLTREEQKLVHISKEMRPRTYRIKRGHSIHIAGLMRLDVEETSADSIYVTVWASSLLPLHMGKMENTCTFVMDHFGRRLQPPIGENRVGELGDWVRKEFKVSGKTWNISSVDVAAAGLGWFAIGINGEATLGAWTYDGVDVVMRSSLIPNRADIFEVAGFTVSKVLSAADKALSKQKNAKRKNQTDFEEEGLHPNSASATEADLGA